MNTLPKVLFLGDSRRKKGGVSTVMKTIETTSVWKKYRCGWLQCQIHGNIVQKVFYLLWAMMKGIFVIPRYDIIHFQNTPGKGLRTQMFFYLYALLWRKKIVLQFHMGNQIAKYTGDWSYRFCTSHADLMLGLGKMWADLIQRSLLEGARTKVDYLYNPVTLPEKVVRPEKYFLFAAYLDENKGYDTLIRAFIRIERQHPEFRLLICGAGKDVERVKEMIAGHQQIVFEGWVTGDDRQRLFAEAYAYCMCSHEEGLPMSVLEEMSYGVPCVSTRVGCLPEFLDDGKSVLFFDTDDEVMLAEKMSYLIAHPELRQQMSERVRALVVASFEKEAVARKLDALYQELTCEKR